MLVVDSGQPFAHATDALKPKRLRRRPLSERAARQRAPRCARQSNQFWLLASCDNTRYLSPAHHAVIKQFFDAGHGVYIWGDNDPCNADADHLAETLVGARVHGDLPGDQVVGNLSKGWGKPGVMLDHLLTTGLEHLYEGVTVATVYPRTPQALTPIVYGSAGNLVTAAFEQDGKRLIIDWGYTRLDYKWDSAGTGATSRTRRRGSRTTSASAARSPRGQRAARRRRRSKPDAVSPA